MHDTKSEEDVIRSERDLFRPFEDEFANPAQRIGLEAEKFGIRIDGTPLHYDAPNGVPAIFAELVSRFGWRAEGESAGSPPLALFRTDESITLEPGSQFELSGSPLDDVHAIAAQVERHRTELAALDSARDLHWIGLGFHPFARQDDLDWVPKSRYATMRTYLPTRGSFALDMMRRTATVQANFDYTSEKDAVRKLRVALAVSPVIQALFANSAVYENVRHAAKSHRAEVWLDVDPDRSGLLPFMWRDGASLGEYVQWALDVPMFVVKHGGRAIPNTGQTFRQFMKDGRDGLRANMVDWETHMNTLFPEVRIKKTLEVRSADGVPSGYGSALPAVWTGILYDAAALDTVADLVVPLGVDAWLAARPHIARDGLGAQVAGRSLAEIARAVVEAATGGLARRARKNPAGADERVYLEPLRELAAKGQSVGDAVLGDWTPSMPHARERLFERARY